MALRPLADLIDTVDPMWPLIQEWSAASPRTVDILPIERSAAEMALGTLQVTTRSPLGASAWETGGILLDYGWLRILGGGHASLHGLLYWNGLGPDAISDPLPGALIVAHDIIGGFFAVDGGAFNHASRHIFYFAPDTLHWEDLHMSHADFLQWALLGDLPLFYRDQRWQGWEAEITEATGKQGLSFWPMLWSQGSAIGERSRRLVPQHELWTIQRDIVAKLAELPPGTPIRVAFAGGA